MRRCPISIKRTSVKFTEQQLKSTGVYCIECIPTGKFYIGSSKDIFSRWKSHRRDMEKNTHANFNLNISCKDYGIENFNFSVLEFCDEDIQFEREQFYLDWYQSYNPEIGFNIATEASAPSMTPETRKKQSISLKKNTKFIEHSRKMMKDMHNDPIKQQKLIDSVKNSKKVKDCLKKLNDSEEHKQQVKDLLDKIHSDPRIQGIVKNLASKNIKSESWRKSHNVHYIGKYTMNKELIDVYDSATDAGEINKLDRFKINKSCKTGKPYGGYYWEFED